MGIFLPHTLFVVKIIYKIFDHRIIFWFIFGFILFCMQHLQFRLSILVKRLNDTEMQLASLSLVQAIDEAPLKESSPEISTDEEIALPSQYNLLEDTVYYNNAFDRPTKECTLGENYIGKTFLICLCRL